MSETEHEQEQTVDEPESPAEPPEEEEDAEDQEQIDGPGDDTETPPAPPEQEGTTPEAWEKRFTKAEQRFSTYTKAITGLWEDDAIHVVPVSISPSAPPGFLDVRDAGRVPE